MRDIQFDLATLLLSLVSHFGLVAIFVFIMMSFGEEGLSFEILWNMLLFVVLGLFLLSYVTGLIAIIQKLKNKNVRTQV
ncbi:MAG TPA: hypothetical protein VJB66_03325 [Candidatus Nanoarchaeia archaeon]|nr:hypothetical protein [Candidatus Nanoarchaeia archaeon]